MVSGKLPSTTNMKIGHTDDANAKEVIMIMIIIIAIIILYLKTLRLNSRKAGELVALLCGVGFYYRFLISVSIND